MNTIAYVGPQNDFCRFLKKAFDGNFLPFETMEQAGAEALAKGYAAVIAVAPEHGLLPSLGYEAMANYAALRKQGIPVYAELYDAGDYNSAMLFGMVTSL